MLTKELIDKRINNFWGYGNLNSNIWFIGMEEGFGGNMLDLLDRFNRTNNKSIVDLQDGMMDVKDHTKWFLPNPNIQRTWSKLILILLTLNFEKKIDNQRIKEFQKKEFSRRLSNHCNLEFMPLPCRSVKEKDWFYAQLGIDYLKNRKEYLRKVMPIRIKLFNNLIKKYSPKIIICYSFSYLNKWKEICGCNLRKIKNLYYCQNAKTCLFVIPHPVAHGIKTNEWVEIAENIRYISNQTS